MASATHVQMWTYAVLLLLVTLLATLLGSSVAETAALSSEQNSAPSNLSLLVAGFVFALTTFAYLLMFLAVGAGALLWICSVLLIVTLAYLLITKAVNHPGREAWARSVHSLTKREDIKPLDRSSAPPSNRASTITMQDPLSEPEAVRPFLNIDLIDDDETPQSNSPPLSHHAPSLPYSRSGSGVPYSHSMSSLPHSYSKSSIPYSSPGDSRTAATSQASLLNARSQSCLVQAQSSHSRSYIQNSLPSTIHNHSYGSPVPPLPPLVIDEKRRERWPTYLPSTSSQAYIPSASLRHNLVIQIPEPRNEEEGTILSAASDVFSVMADDAGSPRSLMSDFHQYPPTQPLALLAEPVSRGPTTRSAATEMWERQALTYAPPLTSGSQWSTNSAQRPHERPQYQGMSSGLTGAAATAGFPPYARRGSPPEPRSDSYAPYASRYHPGPTDTYGHQTQEEEATLFFNERRPAQKPALFVRRNRPEEEEATLFFDSKPRQPSTEEATLFFNAPRVAAAPSPPSGDEATLFFSAPRAPTLPAQDEATLFFSAPRAPALPAQEEATLFFNSPRAPALPAHDEATLFFNAQRPPRPPAQPAKDEATLFFNSKPPTSTHTTNSDEATLFFNAPTIARPPLATVSPEHEQRSSSVSPPRPADEDEATLFFPRR
ncbi:hypothetical protein CspHIS471_0601870 [Cutaneotrichosporon sp. HIS471]|nr:hypothetical protein CspHIS471_0601870 [Cutaneotrichosporon sp. HIS471]